MTDNAHEDAQMSARSRQRQRDREAGSVSITEDTTVNTTLRALWIGGTALVVVAGWAVRVEITMESHSGSLAALTAEAHHVNEKVDALLIDRGINPHKVVQEAEKQADSAKP